MKKLLTCLCLFISLAATAYGGKLSLKLNGGGTYLMGGDFNKHQDGIRDYELSVLGPAETFVDNLKKLGLGYQFGLELLYELSPSLAAGIEVGYLNASVRSGFERTWHSYKEYLTPTLSGLPVTLNVNYFSKLGKKMKLHVVAGAGAVYSSLDYVYSIEATSNPYSGTWTPDSKTVFGAKAGIGLEFKLSAKLALTVDVVGRYGQVKGFTGAWEGIYDGVPRSGTGTLYFYHYDGIYPLVGIYETVPSSAHITDATEAKFSLSGVSALIGIRIIL